MRLKKAKSPYALLVTLALPLLPLNKSLPLLPLLQRLHLHQFLLLVKHLLPMHHLLYLPATK